MGTRTWIACGGSPYPLSMSTRRHEVAKRRQAVAATAGIATGAYERPEPAPTLTAEQYDRLVEAGIVAGVEMIDGRIYMGEWELVFSPAQARAAAALGVRVFSAVDAVLEVESQ